MGSSLELQMGLCGASIDRNRVVWISEVDVEAGILVYLWESVEGQRYSTLIIINSVHVIKDQERLERKYLDPVLKDLEERDISRDHVPHTLIFLAMPRSKAVLKNMDTPRTEALKKKHVLVLSQSEVQNTIPRAKDELDPEMNKKHHAVSKAGVQRENPQTQDFDSHDAKGKNFPRIAFGLELDELALDQHVVLDRVLQWMSAGPFKAGFNVCKVCKMVAGGAVFFDAMTSSTLVVLLNTEEMSNLELEMSKLKSEKPQKKKVVFHPVISETRIYNTTDSPRQGWMKSDQKLINEERRQRNEYYARGGAPLCRTMRKQSGAFK